MSEQAGPASVTPIDDEIVQERPENQRFGGLTGASPVMRDLFAELLRIARSNLSVLIQGETGTGKELAASAVHEASPRHEGPFVVFDCSAVAPTLAESELFGHERGAFTGAFAGHLGVFERANGGTIFLDEIGELSRELQPKLLRVLEKGELRRLGGSASTRVDVRVVAATHRNLREEVERGRFREDLYYRLAGAQLVVPPLRDRLEDLELLAEQFLAARSPPRKLADLPLQTREMFKAHSWPGNVRELKNALERALLKPEAALERHLVIGEADAGSASPLSILDDDGAVVPLRIARRRAASAFEQRYVQQLLELTQGNILRASRLAQVSRQAFHRLMRKDRP